LGKLSYLSIAHAGIVLFLEWAVTGLRGCSFDLFLPCFLPTLVYDVERAYGGSIAM
jgi:hypothetical protein